MLQLIIQTYVFNNKEFDERLDYTTKQLKKIYYKLDFPSPFYILNYCCTKDNIDFLKFIETKYPLSKLEDDLLDDLRIECIDSDSFNCFLHLCVNANDWDVCELYWDQVLYEHSHGKIATWYFNHY